eukprot:TRINITY_DN8814_c0_g2_i4.p1 TRINITY_DN8814_c0_g2~~TRINITY_DN8814_c0_g2_i4.p1  ORF type:complete len:190 (-),score=-17.09 TRINITY_DN8814_c0_g2_i4:669-1238(-)
MQVQLYIYLSCVMQTLIITNMLKQRQSFDEPLILFLSIICIQYFDLNNQFFFLVQMFSSFWDPDFSDLQRLLQRFLVAQQVWHFAGLFVQQSLYSNKYVQNKQKIQTLLQKTGMRSKGFKKLQSFNILKLFQCSFALIVINHSCLDRKIFLFVLQAQQLCLESKFCRVSSKLMQNCIVSVRNLQYFYKL